MRTELLGIAKLRVRSKNFGYINIIFVSYFSIVTLEKQEKQEMNS